MTDTNDAYDKGFVAATRGDTLYLNPYRYGTPDWVAWRNGHSDAMVMEKWVAWRDSHPTLK